MAELGFVKGGLPKVRVMYRVGTGWTLLRVDGFPAIDMLTKMSYNKTVANVSPQNPCEIRPFMPIVYGFNKRSYNIF